MTPLLFDKLPRSRPRIRRGHVVDCGNGCGSDAPTWVQLKCARGHVWQEMGDWTITELKRGLPCPTCADQAPVRK